MVRLSREDTQSGWSTLQSLAINLDSCCVGGDAGGGLNWSGVSPFRGAWNADSVLEPLDDGPVRLASRVACNKDGKGCICSCEDSYGSWTLNGDSTERMAERKKKGEKDHVRNRGVPFH